MSGRCPLDFSTEAEMFDYLGYLGDRIGDLISNILPFDWEPGEGGAPGPPGRAEVPNVRGLSVEEARLALSREGFRVEILQLEERPAPVMGTVVDQDPAPGTRRHRGRPVRIDVAHPRESHTHPTLGSG
jgi:PASTA domain-containing protein